MNYVEEAVQLFEDGYMCSQAVLAVFCEEFGLSREQAFKISISFGGGMRKGEVCGACTGAIMALGLKYGENKSKSDEMCVKFLDSFKKENGSYICRDLLDCDIRTEEGIKYAIDNNLFKEICPKMVESAAKIAQELIL
ncbi:C-GCAxxG-C-C family protein [Methanobrevibacter millerae]|jgi:C_GCAxxG_C_C family probable redox protein|uniref:C_GCAxxG_C_C family protein n=1 Tax=Methanobrevibacter millerae TaxID=230361 RepID=A0A8T3V9J3_9EURY|nr:C-GCAxxG-C-C family protein [Methanobrevibacter millerae]MBE6504728.1 C_GCAxxG_C_C family protein [Methanobrevibacter millerae]MBR0058424.1 C_GCAxxG_C_C family protein [Methanobrevibacter sp.]